jgi:hypothetical protein
LGNLLKPLFSTSYTLNRTSDLGHSLPYHSKQGFNNKRFTSFNPHHPLTGFLAQNQQSTPLPSVEGKYPEYIAITNPAMYVKIEVDCQ